MKLKKKALTDNLNRMIEWALYILVFSIPFSNTLIEICATTAIVCWLVKRSLMARGAFRIAYTELNLPLFVFFFVSFLSIFFSTYPDISLRAFIRKLAEYVALYFIVVEAVTDRRIIRNITRVLAASLALVCLDGIYQKFIGYDFIRTYRLFSQTSMTGPFKFPNGLGSWLTIASLPFVSLALFLPVKNRARRPMIEDHKRLKAASSILAVLAVYCVYYTYTRGAIMSFIAALLLMVLLRGTRGAYITCGVMLAGLIAIAVALPKAANPYKNLNYYLGLSDLLGGLTSKHRLRMWTAAWRMFMDRPLAGQGLNTFMANYARFKVPDQAVGLWYAHNCYLQIAAETGIFGILAFLWMIWRMAVNSITSYRLIKDDYLKFIFLGLFCGITAFLLHAAVDTSLYSLRLAVLFYFSLGFLMAIKRVALNEVGQVLT